MPVYTPDMDRTNIYLDDETKAAARYLQEMHGIATLSEAIRYAVRDVARRGGWRSAVEQQSRAQHRERRGRPRKEPSE